MSLFQSLAVTAALQGKRCAFGQVTPADEDVEVATGIPIVEGGIVCLAAAPTINHTQSSAKAGSTAGTLNILSFRPTSNSNPTPIVSTTEVLVAWFAWGRDK